MAEDFKINNYYFALKKKKKNSSTCLKIEKGISAQIVRIESIFFFIGIDVFNI